MSHLYPGRDVLDGSRNRREESAVLRNSQLFTSLMGDDGHTSERDTFSRVRQELPQNTGRFSCFSGVVDDESGFRELFDRNPLPMCVYDHATDRIVHANNATLQQYGYSLREMVQKSIVELYVPEEQVRLSQWSAKRSPDVNGSTGYWRHESKNGAVLSVEVFCETMTWGNRTVCLYVLPDVSAQVRDWRERLSFQETVNRSDEMARRSATNLLHILGEISDGFFKVDDRGRFTFVNPGAERLLSVTTDIVGWPIAQLFAGAQNEPLLAAYERCLETGLSMTVEFCLPTTGHWLEAHLCPLPRATLEYSDDTEMRSALAIVLNDVHQTKVLAWKEAEEASVRRQEQLEQRRLFREMLGAVSGGKLQFCETTFDLPTPLVPWGEPLLLADSSALSSLRQLVRDTACTCGFSLDRSQDLVAGAAEAAINALLYGDDTAYAELLVSPDRSRIQIWVIDHGQGIPLETLPHDTLARGRGFSIMLDCADQVHIWTGKKGTTIVLEGDRERK